MLCREPDRILTPDGEDTGAAVFVATFPMPAGTRFDWHTHEDHQLAWAASGVLTVLTGEVDGSTWVLPPTRALWIPAGLPHETASEGRATMRSLYIRPGLSPVTWTDPTPVAASPLLAELIGYLGEPGLPAGHRAHAEVLLADLLTPVPVTTIEVRLPSAPTARRVAEALRADPADRRTLREWGRAGGRERADAGPRVRGGGGRAVRPLADPAAAAGGAVHARRRPAGQPGGGPGRLRHPERVRGRVPPRDGPDPRVVLQPEPVFIP